MNKITFNFEVLKWENITVEQVKFWESVYPDVDVIEHITKRMVAWLDANPNRAKKNYKRFIQNWLSRQQGGYEYFKVRNLEKKGFPYLPKEKK